MKKVKIILITICIAAFIIFFGKILWDGILSHVFPWTKTNFCNYQEYIELLDEHHFYASYRFVKEIPKEAADVKYYWHQDYKEKYAAHSIVIAENYEKIAEGRMPPYLECCDGNTTELVYALQEERCGIDDLRRAGVEIDFIQNVLQNSEEQQEYYCLVVIKIGRCYTGVILNDTTQEIIEFSVEVPDREQREEQVEEEDTWLSVDTVIGIIHILKRFSESFL